VGIEDEENREVEPYKHPHAKNHVKRHFGHLFDEDANHGI
jgi:hypothetical protein